MHAGENIGNTEVAVRFGPKTAVASPGILRGRRAKPAGKPCRCAANCREEGRVMAPADERAGAGRHRGIRLCSEPQISPHRIRPGGRIGSKVSAWWRLSADRIRGEVDLHRREARRRSRSRCPRSRKERRRRHLPVCRLSSGDSVLSVFPLPRRPHAGGAPSLAPQR